MVRVIMRTKSDENVGIVTSSEASLPSKFVWAKRQINLCTLLLDGITPEDAAKAAGYPHANGAVFRLMSRPWVAECMEAVQLERSRRDKSAARRILEDIARSDPAEVAQVIAMNPKQWTKRELAKLKGIDAVEVRHVTEPDGTKVSTIKVKIANRLGAARALEQMHRMDLNAAKPKLKPGPAMVPGSRRHTEELTARQKLRALQQKMKHGDTALNGEGDATPEKHAEVKAGVRDLLRKPAQAPVERLDPLAQAIHAGRIEDGVQQQGATQGTSGSGADGDEQRGLSGQRPGPIDEADGSFHLSKKNEAQPPLIEGGTGPISVYDPHNLPSDLQNSVGPIQVSARPIPANGESDDAGAGVFVSGHIDDVVLAARGAEVAAEKKPVSLREHSEISDARAAEVRKLLDEAGTLPVGLGPMEVPSAVANVSRETMGSRLDRSDAIEDGVI